MTFQLCREHHYKFSIERGRAGNLNKKNWFVQPHILGEFSSCLAGQFSFFKDQRAWNRQFRTQGFAAEKLAPHYFDSRRRIPLPHRLGLSVLCAIKETEK